MIVKAVLPPFTVAVALLALVPAGASGVADVIKNLGNSFDRSTYYSDQGDLVQYQYVGAGAPHNVRSTQFSGGERLFSSDTISTGTTPVDGTQYLAPGTYPFICTIHPSQMAAELVVREDGAPPPDDGTPPPDGGAPPPAAKHCRSVNNPYPNSRYEGIDLTRIRAEGVPCSRARDVARGGHKKGLRMAPPPSGILNYRWHRWTIRGDLRPSHDRYRASRRDNRVQWRF
jgi:plastocyanin